jgi:dipeptide transport system ATP-binding protein
MVPGQHDRPTGCLLSPRCAYAVERCRREMPVLAGGAGRGVRCHFPLDAAGRPTGGWQPEGMLAESAA